MTHQGIRVFPFNLRERKLTDDESVKTEGGQEDRVRGRIGVQRFLSRIES